MDMAILSQFYNFVSYEFNLVPDVGENYGGYFVEVYGVKEDGNFYEDRIDDFVIHPHDVEDITDHEQIKKFCQRWLNENYGTDFAV
jgi:hypothetical protein